MGNIYLKIVALCKLNVPRYHRIAKEGSWIVIGQVASVLGALVLVRVLTEYLEPTQYGELALGMTVAGLVNQIAMGGLNNGISRFYSVAAEKHDLPGYLRASWRLMGYCSLLVGLIGLLLILGLLFLDYSRWIGLAGAALVFALLSGYNSTLSGIQNAARQRAIVAFHGGLDAWLKILLVLGLLLWIGSSSSVVVIGYAFSSLLVTGSQFIFLRKVIVPESERSRYDFDWTSKIWAFSWPFSTWGIFTWMQQVSDRWALEAFRATKDVGLYAVLFQLGNYPIAIATGLAMSFIAPILFQRAGDATDNARNTDVRQLVWRIVLGCMSITLVAFSLGIWIHRLVFKILVATEYHSVSYLLPWILLASGLFAAGQMLSIILLSEMKSSAMTAAKIVTALLGILFNYLGASIAGISGVVVATLAFSSLYFIWMFILSYRLNLTGTLALPTL